MNILVVARGIRVRKFDYCARVCILHCIGAWAYACVHASRSPTFLGVEKITAMRILIKHVNYFACRITPQRQSLTS